jgi:hypothetical protein
MFKKKKKEDEEKKPTAFDFMSQKKTADAPSGASLFDRLSGSATGDPKSSKGLSTLPQKGQSTGPQLSAKQMDAQVFNTGSSHTIAYQKTWEQILADVSSWTFFSCSHGCELELVVCDDKGNYLEGDTISSRFTEMVRDATKIMTQIINYERTDFPRIPDYIRGKIKKMPYNRTDNDKGFLMMIDYDLKNTVIPTDSFGRDGNVTMSTFILELVTPPCQYAEELAYWAGTLFNLAKAACPKDWHIMSTALNPTMKEYVRGLSHGDHHHLGSFASEAEKVQAYDMIRNFIPHIIALSVNSPILNNKPTDVIKTKLEGQKPRYVAPNCIRSIRLANNTTMLSSNESKIFLPYLKTGDARDKQYFLQVLQKASLYDARFQDVFPFTKYNTIEVRVMDAQLSICRRIGMGLVLEALVYKAKKLFAQKKLVPDAGSDTITGNRRSAVERGLVGIFKPVNLTYDALAAQDPVFAQCYLGLPDRPYRFLFEAVQGMFLYLKPELKELGYLYSPFLKPILQSVFGEITYAAPPMTEAEYQLSLYDYREKNGEVPSVYRDLIYFTLQYSKDPLQNPLTGDLTLPDYMVN